MAGVVGFFGLIIIVVYLAVFVGLVILGWNAYLALQIYIKKNSDVLKKADE